MSSWYWKTAHMVRSLEMCPTTLLTSFENSNSSKPYKTFIYRDEQNVIAKQGNRADHGQIRVAELTWEHCASTFDTRVLRPPYVNPRDHRFEFDQAVARRKILAQPELEGYRCDCVGCGPDLSIIEVAGLYDQDAIPLLYRCCKALPANNLVRDQMDGHFCTECGNLKNQRWKGCTSVA